MKQAISGVAPPDLGEVTVMTVWPSIAANPVGRALGRMYAIRAGLGNFLTIGKLMMALTIPVALGLYFFRLAPFACRRYRLTNRRVLILNGPTGVAERAIGLDEFDTVDLVVLPGQEWYKAGELIFRRGTIEALRLRGVSRPETFRQTCLKAQRSRAGVNRALQLQGAGA
jgi:hypothetical protein